jgi:hypothetical protein
MSSLPHILEAIKSDWIVAFSALVTAFLTYFLVRYSKQLKDLTREVHAANIASQRAYVSVSPECKPIHNEKDELVALSVCVVWKNSGTTPATSVISLVATRHLANAKEFKFDKPTHERPQQFVLAPRAEIPSGTIDIPAQHVLAAADGSGHQFLWGWAKYRDIFPNSPEHVIEFCCKLVIEGQNAYFIAHGDHNRYYDNPA